MMMPDSEGRHPLLFYPILVNIEKVVIIAGGQEWQRKVEQWAAIADQVVVAAPEPLSSRDNVTVVPGLPTVEDIPRLIAGATLVISEHPEASFNEALYAACRRYNILLNVVDNRSLSNVYAMSYIDKPNLLVALSTKGRCPFYTKQLRLELEPLMEHHNQVAGILAAVREKVPPEQRRQALAAVYADAEFTSRLQARAYTAARRRALEIARRYQPHRETDT